MFKLNKITAGMALAGSVAAISALPSIAFAEESLALEEVTVTARKKVESLQDVAISVTSVSAQLQNAAVKNIQDVQNYVPNLTIDFGPASANGATISIRGLSSQDPDKSVEAPVGMIVDGISMGTTAGQMLDNFDIDSIEVLRGPQGTLFGKNTTGGALNVTRSKPTREMGAKFKISAGDFGTREVRAILNAPLSDNGGVKVFATDVESDGFIKNTTTGRDTGGKDYQQFGAAVSFDVTEDFDVLFSFDQINDTSERGAFANLNQFDNLACLATRGGLYVPNFYAPDPSAVPPLFDMPAAPGAMGGSGAACQALDAGSDKDHVSTNEHNTGSVDNDFASLNMNLALGDWTLTSITGYQDRQETYSYDWDASAVDFLTVVGAHDYSQFSQELRINGDINENINLTAGLYYFDSKYRQAQTSHQMWYYFGFGPKNPLNVDYDPMNPGLPPGDVTSTLDGTGTNETTAVFASMDWNLTEDLLLSVGGRYSWEEKTLAAADASYDSAFLDSIGMALVPGGPTVNFKDDWKEFSPRVALQYNVNDDVMVFTSFAEGFKSGGFFARAATIDGINKFDPEYVSTFELGVKSELFDNRVRLNATAFTSDYKDKQEEVIVNLGGGDVPTFVKNVGNATINGLEIEANAQLTSGLSAYAVVGLLDAKYDEFFADISGDTVKTDNSALQFRNAPEKTFGVGFDYVMPVSFGEISTNYSYRWSDKYETDFSNDPLGQVDAMGMHNLSLNLNIGENYRISAYGRNLTDERYSRIVKIATLSQMGMWNAPRNYGVEFIAEF